jgi:hypothetical protein
VYAGASGDSNIAIDSGLVQAILKGYGLLYDKGCGRLPAEYERHGRQCWTPAFKAAGILTPAEMTSSKDLSGKRSHVERGVKVIKRFKILDTVMKLEHVHCFDLILNVVCGLTRYVPRLW